MGLFRDTFTRAAGTVVGNGWTTGDMALANGVVTNNSAIAAVEATQDSTLPERVEQRVSALVVARVEHATNSIITIWTHYNGASPWQGWGVSLDFVTGGARNLAIWRLQTEADAKGPVSLGTAVVTTSTLKVSSSDLDVLQEIRLIVTKKGGADGGGVRCRAYINNADDSSPDLEVLDQLFDLAAVGKYAFDFGDVGALNKLGITTFEGVEYQDSELLSFKYGDSRTLSEIRTDVEARIDRSSSGSWPLAATINGFINDALHTVVEDLGDLAGFLNRMDQIDLRSDGTDGLVLMPSHIDQVHEIRRYRAGWNDFEDHGDVRWQRLADDEHGRIRIQIDPAPTSATNYWVRFREKAPDLSVDTDQVPIPRAYDEVIVVGAALRMAEFDNDSRLESSLRRRYEYLMHVFKKAMNRRLRMSGRRMSGPVRKSHFSRYVPSEMVWWNYGF